MSGQNVPLGGKAPSRSEVREELETLLRDESFAAADRLSRMLRYLVETALDGSPANLKEYTVGLDVFDRDPSFDPRQDSAVRVHGSRLRTKLADYYAGRGSTDRVVIDLPKGGYIPVFRYRVEPTPDRRVIPLEPRPVIVPPLPPARSSRFSRSKLAVAAVGVLLLAAAVAMLPGVRGPSVQPPQARPLTSLAGNQKHPSFSPDGSQVVFAWEGENMDNVDLYLTMRSGGPLRRLTTDPKPDDFPVWSPDGRWIAFVRANRQVMLVSPLGGLERKIADTDGLFVSWTPDAGSVLFGRLESGNTAIYQVSITSGVERRITAPDEKPDSIEPFLISPDGKYLVYARRNGRTATPELYVRELAGGAVKQLTHGGAIIHGFAWMPDSREIVFASKRTRTFALWRVGVSGWAGGAAVPVPDTADASYPTIVRAGGPSGNLTLLAYESWSRHGGLREVELHPGSPAPALGARAARPILPSTGVDSSPQFSPDGKWIAWTSDRSGFEEIWRSDISGENPTQLTSVGAKGHPAGSPHWSPDSQQIVFDVKEQTNTNVYVVGAQGGAPRKVTAWKFDTVRPSWSSDGKWIYFGSPGKAWALWKVPAGASEAGPEQGIEVAKGGVEGSESVDGSTVYYYRVVTKTHGELFRQPVAGGAATELMDVATFHGWWRPAKRGIYFLNMASEQPAAPTANSRWPIGFFSFDTQRVSEIGAIDGQLNLLTPDFCVSPDERRLLYGRMEFANTNIMVVDRFR